MDRSNNACKGIVTLALILAALVSARCGPAPAPLPREEAAADRPSLVIALLPEQNVFEQKKRYRPLGEYLSERMDRDVRFRLLDSYDAIFQEIKEERVDGAFFGSLSFVLAHLQAGVEVLARPVWANGQSTYSGYIFTRRDSGVTEDVESWRGKRFAFVHTATTAGYVFPLAYLRSQGVDDPAAFFSRAIFTGSHDASALAVFQGEADLGAGKNHVFERLARNDPVFRQSMRILAASGDVPSNGLALGRNVDRNLRETLKETLLAMHDDPQGRQVLDGFGAQRFIETTLQEYAPVVQLSEQAGLDLLHYPISEDLAFLSSRQPTRD